MKYILCVDTQPQLNPSEDIRKYILEVEELRKKDNTFDTLVVNNEGHITVVRRIGILDGKTYKLDEEITEELYNIDIELFNGVNYVYLENITGLPMTLDYVLTNDTFDSYPTMVQMNSAITQTASSIEISVNAQIEGLRAQTIKEVDVEYALSLSNQVAPITGWSTVAPVWESGKYMWQRTKTTYGDNTVETSEPTCISGAKGDKGDTGDTGQAGQDGDDGIGVTALVEQYYLSTSSSSQTGGSWKNTQDPWEKGKYIWTRNKITWTNNTTTYTTPILATGINNANEVANDTSEDLSQNYSTTVQMNAAITTKANEINSVVATKVGNNEVISKINQSSEQITINASKIKLEGYTTINNGFAIDNNGNASIANGSVIIDTTGIKMADNTQIIGGQGLMTNLQLVGELSSQNANNLFNQFWWYDYGTFRFFSDYIIIPVDIPSNFTVTNANIKLIEHPVYWSNHSRYGYVKELGLYQINSSSKLTANFQSSADIYSGMITRISNCWGTNRTTTWTPTTPTDNNYGAQTVKSIDLKNFLDNDNNITFAIKSDHTETYDESTSTRIEAENTCYVTAVLNVYGFMAFE